MNHLKRNLGTDLKKQNKIMEEAWDKLNEPFSRGMHLFDIEAVLDEVEKGDVSTLDSLPHNLKLEVAYALEKREKQLQAK